MGTTDRERSLRRLIAAGGWLDIALACSCVAFIAAALVYLTAGQGSITADSIGEAIGITFALLVIYVILFIFFFLLLIAAGFSAFVGARSIVMAKRAPERTAVKRYLVCPIVSASVFSVGAAVLLPILLPAALAVMLAAETGVFIACAVSSAVVKGVALSRLKGGVGGKEELLPPA